jgi:hypothetical protein
MSWEARDESHAIARKLDSIGWGAFFVWIGAVLLAEVSAGWTLTVIGLIMIGVQLSRLLFDLRLEGFWMIVGGCFLLGGVGQMLGARMDVVPVLLIIAGGVVILTNLWPTRWRRRPA